MNRVARPYYGEALRLLSEGAATPASIDAIMRESGGFRMGPFELMDLIGHDVNFAVTKSIFEAYFGDRRLYAVSHPAGIGRSGFSGQEIGARVLRIRRTMPARLKFRPKPHIAHARRCGMRS